MHFRLCSSLEIFTTALLGIVLFSGNICVAQTDAVPVVNTTSGTYQGYSPYPGVHAYEGIPYALPPVGDLRFEPPRPFGGDFMTLQIRDATQPFAGCYQVQYFGILSDKVAGYRESEDCLFVNVWVPSNATRNSSLPVLTWLYGGGFVSGHTEPHEGVKFVSEHRDVIFVSFNYRTNIFGFPESNSLETKNVGLLDQRLALEWIRDNIGSFGGDSSRITFMGISAGSMSISAYAYAYPDDPIVNGMILMSGQATSIDPGTPEQWLDVVNATNCVRDSAEEELECMKALPARELRRGISPSNLIDFGETAVGGTPVVDNKTLFSTQEYIDRGVAGQFAQVAMFALTTLHEGDGIAPFDPEQGVNQTLSDLLTALVFHCPTALATGFHAAADLPTYRAMYSGTFPALQPYPWARAYHGADAYLFMAAEERYAYEDVDPETVTAAGTLLRAAVAAFVRDPADGLTGELGWPRYDPSNATLVNLFANNTATFTFNDPGDYDGVCDGLPESLK